MTDGRDKPTAVRFNFMDVAHDIIYTPVWMFRDDPDTKGTMPCGIKIACFMGCCSMFPGVGRPACGGERREQGRAQADHARSVRCAALWPVCEGVEFARESRMGFRAIERVFIM